MASAEKSVKKMSQERLEMHLKLIDEEKKHLEEQKIVQMKIQREKLNKILKQSEFDDINTGEFHQIPQLPAKSTKKKGKKKKTSTSKVSDSTPITHEEVRLGSNQKESAKMDSYELSDIVPEEPELQQEENDEADFYETAINDMPEGPLQNRAAIFGHLLLVVLIVFYGILTCNFWNVISTTLIYIRVVFFFVRIDNFLGLLLIIFLDIINAYLFDKGFGSILMISCITYVLQNIETIFGK